MNEKELEILKKINSKLGALIALEMVEYDHSTNRQKIKSLSDIGLNYNDIASILHLSPGYVSKEKALLQKRKDR